MDILDYYRNKFKSTLSDDELQMLNERYKSGDVHTIEDVKELLKITGRKAIKAREETINAKKEFKTTAFIDFFDNLLADNLETIQDTCKIIDEA